MADDARLGKAGNVGVGDGGRLARLVGERAETGAEHDAQGRQGVEAAGLQGRDRGIAECSCIGSSLSQLAQMPRPEQFRQQLAERETSHARPRVQRHGHGVASSANSRMRWRQPPHGVQSASPSPTTQISAMRRSPACAIAEMALVSAQTPSG